jgi:heme-degrading monooxygenase HmoA
MIVIVVREALLNSVHLVPEFAHIYQKRRYRKMAYMSVRHSVQDYKTWKSAFDSNSDLRKKNGEKSYRILRPENGANDVVILFEWDNLDNARKFASSPELKEAMQRAGVTGRPEILFLEEAAQG